MISIPFISMYHDIIIYVSWWVSIELCEHVVFWLLQKRVRVFGECCRMSLCPMRPSPIHPRSTVQKFQSTTKCGLQNVCQATHHGSVSLGYPDEEVDTAVWNEFSKEVQTLTMAQGHENVLRCSLQLRSTLPSFIFSSCSVVWRIIVAYSFLR